MAILKQFTDEEILQVLDESLAANDRGDYEEEKRLLRQLPLEPVSAKVAKKIYGKEYLIQEAYDLSLANQEFGEGWLDKHDD